MLEFEHETLVDPEKLVGERDYYIKGVWLDKVVRPAFACSLWRLCGVEFFFYVI
jgi:hypothetical protein